MRLDLALVERHLVESREDAKKAIDSGSVLVNNILVTKKTKEVKPEDAITISWEKKYVSRGGEKLEGILYYYFEDKEAVINYLISKNALDIGSSTGGFTDFLLKHGISHVTCIDVGNNQLHSTLRTNPKISLFEDTDIRSFSDSRHSYDIIVADLSFIPLKKVVDDIARLSQSGTLCFLLIKPQFEVGKGNLKKGILKNEALLEPLFLDYRTLFEDKGFIEIDIQPCSIKGGDGNQEYFLVCKKA
ncbi:MAG: hypothetical protein RI935_6 [Candidatus Parcubacteria bacterium]|jgi:23S rRNA (cytidine1920-2'-O)/16S rRNA (cytidine1409-2'-O)-methyltransferase